MKTGLIVEDEASPITQELWDMLNNLTIKNTKKISIVGTKARIKDSSLLRSI